MEKDPRSEAERSKEDFQKVHESSGSGEMEFFQKILEWFLLEGKFSWEKAGKRFLEQLTSFFGFDCAGIWFWGGLKFQKIVGYGFSEESGENLSLPDAPWWQEEIKKEPFFFSPGDISGEAQEVKGFFERFHCAHFVLLPLWVQGKPWGLLLGGRKDAQKPWGEKERCQMEFLGRLFEHLGEIFQMVQDFSWERTFLRLILERMPDVIVFKDRQSRFLWTSSFHLQILGASQMEDVVGKTDFDFFPLEEAQVFYQDEQRVMETGEPIVNRLEKAHFHDGTVHWMLTTKVPVQDETGEVIGILGLARDVTLFKEAEEELSLKRNFLLTIIEAMPDHIYVKDREHRFVLVNQSCARHLGFSSPEDLLDKTDFDLHPPELARRFWEEEERILKTRDAEINLEREADDFSTGTKRRIWVLVHKVPVCDERGQILGLLGINRDITERREMERALLFERNLLRSIIDTIPDHVYVKDLNHRFLLVNEADARHHGFSSPQEMLGKTDFDLHPPELARRFWEEEEKMFATGETILNDERRVDDFSTGKRRKIWVSANKAPLYDERGKIVGMVGVSRDITERKAMEEALRESEREKALILNALQDQVTYYDSDLRILWVNRAVFDNFGLSPWDVIGKRCYEAVEGRDAPCPGCAVVKAFQTGKPEEGEIVAYNNTVWHQKAYPILDENGRVFRVVQVSVNITERKKIEERIRYLSFHDPLTGLYNRFFFQEELKRLDTPRQLPLSIIMGDLNNLKLVNDAFGHETGDELLKRTASILLRSCRQEDIVTRFGGDEFLILLPQTSALVVQKIIERIRKLCQEESKGSENYIPLSISLGCATKEKEEENIQAVINEAESRMYRNKLVESRSARSALITSLERSLWEISEETEAHSRRLRDITLEMGVTLGLSSSDLDALELLARLHDLGKLGVSRSILSKPGPLDEREWEEVKRHPEIGYRIAQASPDLLPVAEGILAHHERFDGTGYPQGLQGEEIPLLARIIAIVDAFDAMTSVRPYRKALTKEEALEEIQRNAGTQFDPHLVSVFLRVIGGGSTEKHRESQENKNHD